MYTPETEGIDHINSYSKSKTQLGKLLSNFTYSPINLKNDGQFNSIEGYWYWLLCVGHPERDRLRSLSGFKAKQEGRKLSQGDWRDDEEFKQKIKKALWCKLRFNRGLKNLLRESTLPIVHYYAYGNPPRVTTPSNGKWLWEWYEEARKYLKDNPNK